MAMGLEVRARVDFVRSVKVFSELILTKFDLLPRQ